MPVRVLPARLAALALAASCIATLAPATGPAMGRAIGQSHPTDATPPAPTVRVGTVPVAAPAPRSWPTLNTAAPRRDLAPRLAKVLTDTPEIPGIGAAIIRDGALVALGVAGTRSKDSTTPVLPTDHWHLGSCTKAFTATLAAILVEDGVITFDTTLAQSFPELVPGMSPHWPDITLAQLSSNSAGITGDMRAGGLWSRLWNHAGPESLARWHALETMAARASDAPPGTKHIYSNAGFTFAGLMLERATGRPYDSLIAEYLFAPLGITDPVWGVAGADTAQDAKTPATIWGHTRAGKPVMPARNADNPPAISPAGRVSLTLEDWARFVNLHLIGHRAAFPPAAPTPAAPSATAPPATAPPATGLLPQTVRTLHTPPIAGTDYAFGWVVQPLPGLGTTLWHNGSNTTWYAFMRFAPEHNAATIVAVNIASPGATKAVSQLVEELLRTELNIAKPD
ncbi:MAG: serine hydrolase domain-containing protein [Phycisphaerales bacterium]